MIVFKLSMPNKGSWNNQWTGEGRLYARVYQNKSVPKEYIGQDFYYTWSDGWTACISVEEVDSKEAAKIRKKSAGFMGYDWMIESIINRGYIITDTNYIDQNGSDWQKKIMNVYHIVSGSHPNRDYTELLNITFFDYAIKRLIENDLVSEDDVIFDDFTIGDFLRRCENGVDMWLHGEMKDNHMYYNKITLFVKDTEIDHLNEIDDTINYLTKISTNYEKTYSFGITTHIFSF